MLWRRPRYCLFFLLLLLQAQALSDPLRWTEDASRLTQGNARKKIVLPLNENWTLSSAGLLRIEAGEIHLKAEGEALVVAFPFHGDLSAWNSLMIEMKVDRGAQAKLSWEGALEPRHKANPGTSISLLADNAFHRYTIPFCFQDGTPWIGACHHFFFTPSNEAATVSIRSAVLMGRPPQEAMRLDLAGRTLESALNAQFRWAFTVPESASLQIGMGMGPRSALLSQGDGVQYTVEMKTATDARISLFESLLNPALKQEEAAWRLRTIDLAPWAGQEVTLHFEQDTRSNTVGDYAFWAAPLVFQRHQAQDARPPVFLISCDTLRAENVSCYGYHRPTTPNLDAFAHDAVLFEQAFANEVWTPTSHMSMLTGLYPKNHGLTANINLDEKILTLPEVLREAGYLSAAFTGMSWWFAPWRGFAQGLDELNIPAFYRTVFDSHALAKAWLDAHPTQPLFMFLHNYDIHSRFEGRLPYDAQDDRFKSFSDAVGVPEDAFVRSDKPGVEATRLLAQHNAGASTLSAQEEASLVALYDDCVQKVDFAIGEWLALLKRKKIYDRALIIITSDHGESLGDHGRHIHGNVYEENIHVPLVIKFPENQYAGKRVQALVQLTDLMPTVLDVLDLPVPTALDGRSMIAFIEDREEPAPAVFAKRGVWRTLREKDQKIIKNLAENQHQYFKLSEDPKETKNRYTTLDPTENARLSPRLDRFYQPAPEGWQIRLSKGAEDWEAQFTLTTSDRIVSARLSQGNLLERNDQISTSQALEGTATLSGDIPTDTLRVKLSDAQAVLGLDIQSEEAFTVSLGGVEHPEKRHFYTVLDPSAATIRQRPSDPSPSKEPHIAIWWIPPATGGASARQLTDQAIEELNALGYGGAVQ